jgi:hypothetical protein
MTITTGPTQATTGRLVDADVQRALRMSYSEVGRANNNSVRAAWRFGQCIDSFLDAYTMGQLADALRLSKGTLGRYHRLYGAYQRPELAVEASEQLQTYNIDLIFQLQNMLTPVEHARPYAGRRYRYRCNHCYSEDVAREEFDPATGATLDPATGEPMRP